MSKIDSRTTIDNLRIDAHQRYAKDQKDLDTRFVTDSSAVSPHAEIAGTSAIYSSQLEQLIQSYVGTMPWASFHAPGGYFVQTNRFFRSRLFPQTKKSLLQHDDKEKGGGHEQKGDDEEQDPLIDLLENAFAARASASSLQAALPQEEREKGTLLTLIQEIGRIDALLAYITARKLQYQKG